MSRRNRNGSSAKKRREKLRSRRAWRPEYRGTLFWVAMASLERDIGQALGDAIHARLERTLAEHRGELPALPPSLAVQALIDTHVGYIDRHCCVGEAMLIRFSPKEGRDDQS